LNPAPPVTPPAGPSGQRRIFRKLLMKDVDARQQVHYQRRFTLS
jgi:hypothetical protein